MTRQIGGKLRSAVIGTGATAVLITTLQLARPLFDDGPTGYRPGHAHAVAYDPTDDSAVLVATYTGVWRIHSLGAQGLGPDDYDVTAVSADQSRIVIAGKLKAQATTSHTARLTSDSVFTSLDRGVRWTAEPLPRRVEVVAVAIRDEYASIAAAEPNVLLSRQDAGVWGAIETPALRDIAVRPSGPITLLAVAQSQLLISPTPGANLHVGPSVDVEAIDWIDVNALYGLASDGSIQLSTDLGATWTTIGKAPPHTVDIAVRPRDRQIAAAIDDGRVATSPDGDTWTFLTGSS